MKGETIAEVIRILKRGGVAIVPSDTILGIMGSALKPRTVERIYRIRGRNRKKPLIVLIASVRDLRKFGIVPTLRFSLFLKKVWPGPMQPSHKASAGAVSIILPCSSRKFRYLHRGTETVAFRIPQPPIFRKFLKATGPLVAPSANPEGLPPARTITGARRMFGSSVDAYLPGRIRSTTPSLLVRVLRS